jgi:hypothetical protein
MYVLMTKLPNEPGFDFVAIFDTYAEAAKEALNYTEETLIFEEPSLVRPK